MLFAFVLVNAFVVKELHYIIEFSHDHAHHHDLVDRHADCENTTHFHSYNFDSNCSICDFNFSPRDQVNAKVALSAPAIISLSFIDVEKITILEQAGAPPSLRGPPSSFL